MVREEGLGTGREAAGGGRSSMTQSLRSMRDVVCAVASDTGDTGEGVSASSAISFNDDESPLLSASNAAMRA